MEALTGAAKGIHEQIVGSEGFDPSTDEYYAEIDKRMKVFLDKSQGNKQNAPAVAPASSGRSATKKGGKTNGKIDSRSDEFLPENRKIPLEKYAAEVAKTRKNRGAPND